MPVLKINKNGQWVEVWGSAGGGTASSPKLTEVYIPVESWNDEGDLYYQVVDCNGVTAYSKLDLQPTPEQIISLQNEEISLMATNNNGMVTVYAIGGRPSSDYTMSVLITEVIVV